MKIEYVRNEPDQVEEIKRKISKTQATFLSRLPGELVAIVPGVRCADQTFNWVWLASCEGAYLSNTNRTLEQVAQTIVYGEWRIQPNVKIILEE